MEAAGQFNRLCFVLCVLGITSTAHATASVVQSTASCHYVYDGAATLTGVNTSDEVIAVAGNSSSANTLSIDNNCGGSWTVLLNNDTSTSQTLSTWINATPSATCEVDVTPSAGNAVTGLVVTEISGSGASDATPVPYKNAYCQGSCITGSITPATTGDLIVFSILDYSQVQTYSSPTNGFSIAFQASLVPDIFAQGMSYADLDQVYNSITSISGGYTQTTASSDSKSVIMAFKPSGSTGASSHSSKKKKLMKLGVL